MVVLYLFMGSETSANYCVVFLGDKSSMPSLELEENASSGATGGIQEKTELSSEHSSSLPDLNLSDL